MSNTTIAQEFYKVRETWATVTNKHSWKLAIWMAQYQDIDLIDNFIETERLAIGIFENDLFFRFTSVFDGNVEAFEKQLWNEYISWFQPSQDPSKDILGALRNDGILDHSFEPIFSPESGFSGLAEEMMRFKGFLKGAEQVYFCLYFPPNKLDKWMLGDWLNKKLKEPLPSYIRLVTVDYLASPKITIKEKHKMVELNPQLNMLDAINNEMDKGGGNSDAVGIESRLTKQIRTVMDTIVKMDASLTDFEVGKMLSLSKSMKNNATYVSSLLVAAQAHYNIKSHEKCSYYAEKAIKESEKAMESGDVTGYHTWKACMMLKGAVLSTNRKWEEAIGVYESMAKTALDNSDVFFAMEGYRISGHLYFIRGRYEPGFENSLLALVAGSQLDLDIRRQSTYLHAAYLANFLGQRVRSGEELQALSNQLSEWIGNDWETLISGIEFAKSTEKPEIHSTYFK